MKDFDIWVQYSQQQVEDTLSDCVGTHAPAALAEPMRYAVLDGGKRLRPLLVLAACTAVEGAQPAALRAACAVELIHAYSLVHDDMPCMDDDAMRRGKPSVHVQFGQASALLTGDALQSLAFELLTPDDTQLITSTMQATLCRYLAHAAGAQGMAGGQAIDLASVGKPLNQEQLIQMHQLKTGALLQASVLMGAACGNPDTVAIAALKAYSASIGLAFQVVDDILDVTADSSTLGKTAGKDAANNKPTYVSLLGLEAARQYAQELHRAAHNYLQESGLPSTQTQYLYALADNVIHRVY